MEDAYPLPADIRHAAGVLWDYMHLNHPLETCSAAIAMGSHDPRTAAYAAQLVLDGWAPLLVCSGAAGRLTEGVWTQSEARLFAEEALRAGLGADKVLLEDRSTNTAENLQFSAELLKKNQIPFTQVLLIHKPYMERRVWATAQRVWPQIPVVVTSLPIPMDEYANEKMPIKDVISIMAGDFQRVIEYPKRDYAIAQEIPESAMRAFDLLVSRGFTTHLL